MSRCCCARANHAIMFLKKFSTKGSSSEFALFYPFFRLLKLTKLHKDATLNLYV